jgi:hypothetical protein
MGYVNNPSPYPTEKQTQFPVTAIVLIKMKRKSCPVIRQTHGGGRGTALPKFDPGAKRGRVGQQRHAPAAYRRVRELLTIPCQTWYFRALVIKIADPVFAALQQQW